MTDFISSDQIAFSAALGRYVEFARDVLYKGTNSYEGARPHTLDIGKASLGMKYVRLVAYNGTQHSVFGFVRIADGAILYPASWKKPFIAKDGPLSAKTMRGSVYDDTTWAGCTAWTGVRTIR